jgi:molybdenum cofactor cytidylyltransferase
MKVAVIILAAGRSTRMGTNKLVEDLGGRPLVRHVAAVAMASKARPVIVVTGHEPERIETALSGLEIPFVHNPAFADGLSTSLQAGVAALPEEVDAAIVMLGDMPLVQTAVIDALCRAFEAKPDASAAVPVTKGEWGNPVLLSRRVFADVATLQGDAGARKLLTERRAEVIEVPVGGEGVLLDLDTPEALERVRERHRIFDGY